MLKMKTLLKSTIYFMIKIDRIHYHNIKLQYIMINVFFVSRILISYLVGFSLEKGLIR